MPNSTLPDRALLNRITRQHVYLDRKSREAFFPNKEKPKYKLAGNPLLDNYFFHVLTTGKDACKEDCTVVLGKCDWENMVPESTMEDVGYCDLTKFELIERNILIQKIKDKDNGFPTIAKMTDSKYQELLNLHKNLRMVKISKETKEVMLAGINPMYDDILSRLDLK